MLVRLIRKFADDFTYLPADPSAELSRSGRSTVIENARAGSDAPPCHDDTAPAEAGPMPER